MDEFDVVVIGAGPAGENVADYAHSGGLHVAVVEAELVGGECSYWACIPSKAMLRPVQALAAARRVAGAREVAASCPDAGAALGRRDDFVSGYDDAAQVDWVERAGITLVRGQGRLAGERRVVVETEDGPIELRARVGVVVATGTRAVIPPIEGLAEAEPWTSREATSMREVPARLAIIGGGVVACEMAAAARGLGAEQVTMLVRDEQILTKTEPFASELVLTGLRNQGIQVRLNTSATAVRRGSAVPDPTGQDPTGQNRTGQGPTGPVSLRLDDGTDLEADEVLVATGRRPRTDELGLETVGLRPGDGLATDDLLTVTGGGGWLFAVGDVNGRSPVTHQGKYQARLLGDRLAALAHESGEDSLGQHPGPSWGPFTATADTEAAVQVIFTDPHVGMVGLTKAAADDRGLATRSVEYDLGQVAGARLHADGCTGRASMLVDVERGVLLGATIVGPDVAEMVHAATIAVVGEIPLDRLWHAVPAFPTMSEVWLRLLEQWRAQGSGVTGSGTA